jgi:2,4-dienoyl-CoA reductase-like NADH-dependent reductase (Old Yellow Enzyme family)
VAVVKHQHLSEPLTIRSVTLRNRVVSPPMERNYCDLDGTVTDRYVAYLESRARGGTALLFTEASYVRIDGRGREREMGVHGDHVIPGLRRLADAVHAHGALIGVELNHGGRVAQSFVSGHQPVAPSPVPCETTGNEMPRELTAEDIERLVSCFAEGARRCLSAGVDILSIHGAHGYLIHQFLSPRTNTRHDKYGDPVCFVNEVIGAVRVVDRNVPLFLRLSAFEDVEGGLDVDATLNLVRRVDLDAVDVLDISAGAYESGQWQVQPGEVPQGFLADTAARYREFSKVISVAGRISTGEVAESILQAGKSDLVSVGRALHADPDWTNKTLHGKWVRPCIACNQGCIDYLGTHKPIWCVVNPATGNEWLPPSPGSGASRRVAVVGAGVAGLEAARSTAVDGHEVVVFEAGEEIGGQYRLAAGLPSKPEFGRLLAWYHHELQRLNVQLELGVEANASLIEDLAPDTLVVATGSIGAPAALQGDNLPRVVDVRRWLATGARFPVDQPVTVWGADRVGVAVADAIAVRGGSVLLIGPQTELAPEAGRREKILVIPRLADNPTVQVQLGSTLETVEEQRLLVGHEGQLTWHDRPGLLLVSRGVISVRPAWLDELNEDLPMHVIGDAASETSADEAIRQGSAVARLLVQARGGHVKSI